MKIDAFVDAHAERWGELDALVARARRRPDRLAAAEVHRLGDLYRSTAGDLAIARARWPGDPVVRRLEDLVGRARPMVYTGDGESRRVVDFARRGYWRSVRERPGMLALAAVLLLGSAFLSGMWAWRDPQAAQGFVPSQYRVVAEPHRYDNREGPGASTSTALSAEIMTNNITVTFMAFGGGMLLCLGGIYLLLQNGMLLGVLAGLAIGAGNGRPFFELIVPHGVLELSCIIVGAAAGFRIGWSVIAPGSKTRGASLRSEARAAIPMIAGTACWLVVAGLIEGFITPARYGLAPALVIGISVATLYWSLVFVLGRSTAPSSEALRREQATADVADYRLAESFSLR